MVHWNFKIFQGNSCTWRVSRKIWRWRRSYQVKITQCQPNHLSKQSFFEYPDPRLQCFCPPEVAASWSGVITKLTILCPPRPNAVNIAFFACANFEHVRPARADGTGSAMMFWNPKVDRLEAGQSLTQIPGWKTFQKLGASNIHFRIQCKSSTEMDEMTPSPRNVWNTSWHQLIFYDPIIFMDFMSASSTSSISLWTRFNQTWQWLERYSGLLPWHGKNWERS